MARVNLAAIRHFCKMNKVKLDWDLIYAFKGKARTKSKDKAYENADLYKLISACSLRLKLIVLIYSSTGIRAAALPPLKLKNITKIPEQGIYKFQIYDTDDDNSSSYFTLCSPECATVLEEYLSYRERHFESLSPESPLIREDFQTAGFIRQKPRHITTSTITTILTDKLNKIGLREVDHVNGSRSRKSVKIIHGMRKYFESKLLESNVSYIVVKMLMNHDMGLEENYFRPSFEFILSEYCKGIPALEIDPTKRMERQISQMETQRSQFDRLAAQIKALEARIK